LEVIIRAWSIQRIKLEINKKMQTKVYITIEPQNDLVYVFKKRTTLKQILSLKQYEFLGSPTRTQL